MDISTTLHQIGFGNLLAISGGRFKQQGDSLVLPVGKGYSVRIRLAPNDTYTVSREWRGQVYGQMTDIYCEELSETCYRASCFHDEWGIQYA